MKSSTATTSSFSAKPLNMRNYHRAGTPSDCSCLICSSSAENDEVVAVEDFKDVGNILGKSWVSLLPTAEQSPTHYQGRGHVYFPHNFVFTICCHEVRTDDQNMVQRPKYFFYVIFDKNAHFLTTEKMSEFYCEHWGPIFYSFQNTRFSILSPKSNSNKHPCFFIAIGYYRPTRN